MTTDIDLIIDRVIEREGGYVNRLADHGGPTKFGVTQATFSDWLGADATAEDVAALTKDQARLILRELFVLKPGLQKIEDPALREQVIDAAVLHGPRWAIRRLQEVAGLEGDQVDGIIGPITLRAVNFGLKTNGLAGRFAARRIRKLARIVAADIKRRLPREDWGQATFLVGWMNRATEFLME